MKKIILIFTAAAVSTMLFSGCSSEEGPNELDALIEQLQTTHLSGDSPEASGGDEEAIPYKSLIGTVSSLSDAEIAVKSEGKEQKFKIDENTQVLGGNLDSAKTVTVTYCEPEKKSRGVTANVITILETKDVITESTLEPAIESTPDNISDTTPETASETVSEVSADTADEDESSVQTETETDITANTDTDTEAQTESETQTDTETQTGSE